MLSERSCCAWCSAVGGGVVPEVHAHSLAPHQLYNFTGMTCTQVLKLDS
jgi:hypothetical protein